MTSRRTRSTSRKSRWRVTARRPRSRSAVGTQTGRRAVSSSCERTDTGVSTTFPYPIPLLRSVMEIGLQADGDEEELPPEAVECFDRFTGKLSDAAFKLLLRADRRDRGDEAQDVRHPRQLRGRAWALGSARDLRAEGGRRAGGSHGQRADRMHPSQGAPTSPRRTSSPSCSPQRTSKRFGLRGRRQDGHARCAGSCSSQAEPSTVSAWLRDVSGTSLPSIWRQARPSAPVLAPGHYLSRFRRKAVTLVAQAVRPPS